MPNSLHIVFWLCFFALTTIKETFSKETLLKHVRHINWFVFDQCTSKTREKPQNIFETNDFKATWSLKFPKPQNNAIIRQRTCFSLYVDLIHNANNATKLSCAFFFSPHYLWSSFFSDLNCRRPWQQRYVKRMIFSMSQKRLTKDFFTHFNDKRSWKKREERFMIS